VRSVSCVLILTAALLLVPSAVSPAAVSEEEVAATCANEVRGLFWGGVDWLVLGQALAADPSPCVKYSVTVPPMDVRTDLRARARFNELRALGIRPVAEIRWTAPNQTGWREWVVGGHPDWVPGRTFYEAGVEARRRMAERNLNVAAGETWAFNELTKEVLEGAPGARAEVLEFLRGLYDGAAGMAKARGIVFNAGIPSTSGAAEVAAYKAKLQAWLADEAFWGELDGYVDVFANEVYVSSLSWGVSGIPFAKRAKRMNEYLQHVASLVGAAPKSVQAARSVLRRTYMPLANAAWPHPAIGDTHLLDVDQMRHYVSTQVYALRQYAEAYPQVVPAGLIGFAWAPFALGPGYDDVKRNEIAARLANALHLSTAGTPKDACGPATERIWCEGEVDDASFNPAWRAFDSWD
jgi:hypothetical protein